MASFHFLLLSSFALMASSLALNFDDMTPLQKHVSFFDRNKDGIIYFSETFQGLRAIGCGFAVSTAGAVFLNGALSSKTRPNGTLPSPRLPIYVENIKRGMHGSDSGAYDTEGRFVPETFEEIFEKHAHTNPNALTKAEVAEMLKANREPNDVSASLAASVEWILLYSLAKDKDGLLQKETTRSMYDGSLFYQMEKQRAAAKLQKKALNMLTRNRSYKLQKEIDSV